MSALTAVSLPFLFAPSLYLKRVEFRFPLTAIDSSRVNVYLTGLPVITAPNDAIICTEISSLPPKPPPMGIPEI